MALLAIGAHLAAVDVGMTIGALGTDVGKDQLDVALVAFHLLVHAAKRIACLVVAKLRDAADGLPARKRVTVLAGNVDWTVRIARSLLLPGAIHALNPGVQHQEPHENLEK